MFLSFGAPSAPHCLHFTFCVRAGGLISQDKTTPKTFYQSGVFYLAFLQSKKDIMAKCAFKNSPFYFICFQKWKQSILLLYYV